MCYAKAIRIAAICLFFAAPANAVLYSQSAPSSLPQPNAELQLVIVLSRHGVRSPLTSQGELDRYSAKPWPKWEVAPGIQTAHGEELIRILGAWDRSQWDAEHLLPAAGCQSAARVSIYADNDQRTRVTGQDLAESLFPDCRISVDSQPDGVKDPLFNPTATASAHPDPNIESAALLGRLGGNAANLTEAYRPQLEMLDHVLTGCGHVAANARRKSIFDVPAQAANGAIGGPVITGGTLAENLLLEYTQGMSDADTGWGCVDGPTLRALMQLDTASWEYARRTFAVAQPNASNLLERVRLTMEQSLKGKPVTGALGKPGDRLVILVGHDSNIVAVAGALGINWIIDGRADDTPPGGALFFELWRGHSDGKALVRLVYRAQTLEQMRRTEKLSATNPPAQAAIFVPACSQANMSCTWEGFSSAVKNAIDPRFVIP